MFTENYAENVLQPLVSNLLVNSSKNDDDDDDEDDQVFLWNS